VLVPVSVPGEIRVKEVVIVMLSHSAERLLPPLPRTRYRADNDLTLLDFEFYLGAEATLFQ
jgi:hypothetical protein